MEDYFIYMVLKIYLLYRWNFKLLSIYKLLIKYKLEMNSACLIESVFRAIYVSLCKWALRFGATAKDPVSACKAK